MSKGNKTDYNYPEDEFDRIAAENEGPVGTHRRPKGFFRKALPFIIVIILAPALAYLASVFVFSGSDTPAEPNTQQSVEVLNQPAAEPTSQEPVQTQPTSTAPATNDQPTQSDSPETTGQDNTGINMATPVTVLNTTRVQGLAAGARGKLVTKGYSSVTATNFRGTPPATSTVLYPSQAMEATARDVASTLSVNSVTIDPTVTTVTVFLTSDYSR